MAKAFPGRSGDSDTLVWHTDSGTVRSGAVEKTMRHTLEKIAGLPGVSAVQGPYGTHRDGRRQHAADQQGRAHRLRLRALRPAHRRAGRRPGPEGRRHRAGARPADGLQVELGGAGIALTEAPRAQLAEIIGLGAAAVVLFLAFGSLAATFLPIVTALAAVGTASAGITLLSHAMTVADFAPMLGMLIGLGVGIDYALFIVTRHRKGLRRGAAGRRGRHPGRRGVRARGRLRRGHGLHRAAGHADPAAELPQRRRPRRLAHRRADRGRRRHPAAGAARPDRDAGAEPPRAPPAGRARTAARAAHRYRRPLVRRSSSGTPSCWAPSPRPSCSSWRCPTFGLHLGTSDQGNNPATLDHPQGVRPARGRRPAPVAGAASAPASTGR